MFILKYTDIITIENLLATWEHFVSGKRKKKDVIAFELQLGDNLVLLYAELKNKTYKHSKYSAFNISDPKPRNIHKALVRDRVVHHLIYKELYWYFHHRFIFDSYSCRKYKGTHKALDRFKSFAGKVSKNHIRTCYVLKCDIRKFFANINQKILTKILNRHIEDGEIKWLIGQVIDSFKTKNSIYAMADMEKGLPLGNLTSQLLVNIYMHEFDMFMKQELRVKYYIRYADDFVILSENRKYLEELLLKIELFLRNKLYLSLHPDKVFIQTYSSGVDFLGWTHFPHHRTIRTTTKRKILKALKKFPQPETINSYKGLLGHGDTYRIQKKVGIALY
ncbi:MAG: group II intron reverse transcriptase domain-containing protein [Candidatus Zambryskibacteria bacterium]|nr:group II intron reverse transcriptase domain-containing protein [Candidatus Zambryskibacteria bacterium]